MNRLIRIALTLFASATIMVFLVLKRLQHARDSGWIYPDGSVHPLGKSELQMVNFGMGLIGLMLVAGLVLILVAVFQNRKKSVPHG